MSDLLERLKAGRAAIHPVTINQVKLGLRLLTEQDYFEAGLAADAAMKAKGIGLDIGTAELFEAEKSAQLACRFLVDPTSGQTVVSDSEELRSALTRGENEALINAYLEYEKEHSPSGRTLSDEEFNALFEEVKKNPGTARLNDSSSATLKRLITSLANPPTT